MPAALENPLSDADLTEEMNLRRHYGLLPRATEDFGDAAPVLPKDEHPVPMPNQYGIGPDHPFAREQ